MKNFGIIYCGYNTEEYVLDSIEPFLKQKNHVVSAVSVPFAEYKEIDNIHDNTTEILRELVNQKKLKYLVDSPKYISEAEARNLALDHLKKYNLDYIWIVDSDEFYTEDDIAAIEDYVEQSEKHLFKVSFRNFVFDENHYLEEPFCPPRIFSTKIPLPSCSSPHCCLRGRLTWNPSQKREFLNLEKFYWDNDIVYSYNELSAKYTEISDIITIPSSVARVRHYTWFNNNIGKRKVEYQQKHFGHCGFKWNEENSCLEFDKQFHQTHNISLPTVKSINTRSKIKDGQS